ncbi:hypothetical protein BaRGS_00022494 [Batillaria attramentaria]|uniref:Glycosyltransferase n=1 Tax=Batillaria attramentaria TaxID=370345 RepID=A0ABD0KGS1_9CAEN
MSMPRPVTSSRPCSVLPLTFPRNDSFFPCAWRPTVPPKCTHKLRPKLSCINSSVDILYEWVSVDTPPATYNFTDVCLGRVVRERCFGNTTLIPKLVHYVMFGGKQISFYTFLGILSAVRFVQPCLLLLHMDRVPTGLFWDTLLRMVPNIVHVQRSPPKVIFGRKVKVVEHQADIVRLEAMRKFGGMYFDTDYLIVNPLEDLRNHTAVLGVELKNYNYANGVILGKAGAEFFDLWYKNYKTFDDRKWGYHSTILPYELHKKHPEVALYVANTLINPNYNHIKKKFYEHLFNWKSKHGIHLYVRFFRKYFQGNFETKNTSLGQVSRRILFGDSDACFGGRDIVGKLTFLNDFS